MFVCNFVYKSIKKNIKPKIQSKVKHYKYYFTYFVFHERQVYNQSLLLVNLTIHLETVHIRYYVEKIFFIIYKKEKNMQLTSRCRLVNYVNVIHSTRMCKWNFQLLLPI